MHPRNDHEHTRRTNPGGHGATTGSGRAGLLGMAGATVAIALAMFLGPRCDVPEPTTRGRGAATRALAGGDDAVMVAWSVAHPHWGTEAVLVRRDGRARYLLDPPNGGGAPVRAELTLPREDVAELERRLVAARPCDLASTRRTGRTHESRPTLEVALPGARCAVTLWFDEWRESERARAAAEIVAELRSALRRGPDE
jgi:hypothetical protein